MKLTADNVEEEPKWRRKPEKRPDEILAGALIEFRARGFVGARIEDIARHAGLSKGTVYLYFSSKEEMLKELIRRTVRPIADRLKSIAEHVCDDSSDELASDVLRDMLFLVGHGLTDPKVSAIPLVIIGEAGNFPEHADFYRREVIEVSMGALVTVIKRGIDQGEFKAVEPHFAVRSLMGMLLMQVIWNGVFARENDPELPVSDLLNTHLNIFLDGIIMPKEH